MANILGIPSTVWCGCFEISDSEVLETQNQPPHMKFHQLKNTRTKHYEKKLPPPQTKTCSLSEMSLELLVFCRVFSLNPLASVLGWKSPFRGAAGVAGEAYLQRSQQSKGLLSLRGKLPGFHGGGAAGWWLASHLLRFCWAGWNKGNIWRYTYFFGGKYLEIYLS